MNIYDEYIKALTDAFGHACKAIERLEDVLTDIHNRNGLLPEERVKLNKVIESIKNVQYHGKKTNQIIEKIKK